MKNLKSRLKILMIIMAFAGMGLFCIYNVSQFITTISTPTLLFLIGVYLCRNIIFGVVRILWFLIKVVLFIALILFLVL